MKKKTSKTFLIVAVPIFVTSLLVLLLLLFFKDLEKSINLAATIIQMMAVFIGGLWAYHRFGWDKKTESAISLKEALLIYRNQHAIAASQYKDDIINRVDKNKARVKYQSSMMEHFKLISKQISLSLYLPEKLRLKIYNMVFLTVGRTPGKKGKNVYADWERFGEEFKKIIKELESVP